MGQYDALINEAKKAIKKANILLENENTPFNVMYRQYKIIESFWFRVIEDASEGGSRRLEELCIDLENAKMKCEEWIKNNSPTKPAA